MDIINSYYRRIRKAEGVENPAPITLEDVDEKFSDPNFVKTLKGKDAEKRLDEIPLKITQKESDIINKFIK